MSFSNVLIANRGEIAIRVARTCNRLGIRTTGIYAEDDAGSLHLEHVNDTVALDGTGPQATYANPDAVIEAAKRAGADAVHPGYGFLSEHSGFARRCQELGITFIGPAAEHIDLMGEKRQARDAFEGAGFPVLPRLTVADDALPEGVRYPVIVKAAAGGGGIGMTLVHDASGLARALQRVRTAGARYFGSDEVYVEPYLPDARHVEVQVAGDGTRTVHLGERDCSWQRRYQKVVEEAAAPGLPAGFRQALADEAAAAAHRLGYRSVGTVECLVKDDQYYFLEMNTRIQVEHGVTELVYDVDLVEWQLAIASGEGLPAGAPSRTPEGHAIEFRVYAEDPDTGLPSPGTIDAARFPSGEGIRIDTAVRDGSTLPMTYDPMIAKVLVHRATREDAIALAGQVLDAVEISGVKTNLPLLRRILASDDFRVGAYHTGSLAELQRTPAK